ncbi:MAG TPA: CBS domain-containing protein, partial [Actinomycetota bacterium]|nr:CBS domain-containing protein [Actinomycetota bacterium]
KVKDVMTRDVITITPDMTIRDAASRLARNGIAGAPVVEGGRVIGMVTEQDLVRTILPPAPTEGALSALEVLAHVNDVGIEQLDTPVSDSMSTLVVEILPEASVWEAAGEMERRGVNRIPVVDEDGKLVGIVSRADLVRVMGEPR